MHFLLRVRFLANRDLFLAWGTSGQLNEVLAFYSARHSTRHGLTTALSLIPVASAPTLGHLTAVSHPSRPAPSPLSDPAQGLLSEKPFYLHLPIFCPDFEAGANAFLSSFPGWKDSFSSLELPKTF